MLYTGYISKKASKQLLKGGNKMRTVFFENMSRKIYVEKELLRQLFREDEVEIFKDCLELFVRDAIYSERKENWIMSYVIDDMNNVYIKIRVGDMLSPTVDIMKDYAILDKWYNKFFNKDYKHNEE